MRHTTIPGPASPLFEPSLITNRPDAALSVITVYQDPLTRQWAAELWDRVGRLIGQEGLCRQCWKMSDLTDPRVFTDSVRAAARADVLVVGVRDSVALPINLYVWVDAWMPGRGGRAGALVALIGVSPQPDAQSGRAHAYLETIAQRAGMDFLPRERKLPRHPITMGGVLHFGKRASPPIAWAAGAFGINPRPRLDWRVSE